MGTRAAGRGRTACARRRQTAFVHSSNTEPLRTPPELTLTDSRFPSSGDRPRAGRKCAAAAILCGLAALVLYSLRDLVAGTLPGRDSVNLYVWEIYTRSVLATGQLPLWYPLHLGGTAH